MHSGMASVKEINIYVDCTKFRGAQLSYRITDVDTVRVMQAIHTDKQGDSHQPSSFKALPS
jgi:hypothetical protein